MTPYITLNNFPEEIIIRKKLRLIIILRNLKIKDKYYKHILKQK